MSSAKTWGMEVRASRTHLAPNALHDTLFSWRTRKGMKGMVQVLGYANMGVFA
jgi:hypothetical protein